MMTEKVNTTTGWEAAVTVRRRKGSFSWLLSVKVVNVDAAGAVNGARKGEAEAMIDMLTGLDGVVAAGLVIDLMTNLDGVGVDVTGLVMDMTVVAIDEVIDNFARRNLPNST